MKSIEALDTLNGSVREEILAKARKLLPIVDQLDLPAPTFTVGANQSLGIAWHKGTRHAAINLSGGEMFLALSGDGEGTDMKYLSPLSITTEIAKIGSWLG